MVCFFLTANTTEGSNCQIFSTHIPIYLVAKIQIKLYSLNQEDRKQILAVTYYTYGPDHLSPSPSHSIIIEILQKVEIISCASNVFQHFLDAI